MTGDRFTAAQAADWGMVNHVVPRDDLAGKVDELAAKMVAMPMQGLFLSKKAVNICEDNMGLRNSMDSVFGWHHYAHAANSEARRGFTRRYGCQVHEGFGYSGFGNHGSGELRWICFSIPPRTNFAPRSAPG